MSSICSKYNGSPQNRDPIYDGDNLFSYESSSTEESSPPNPQPVQNNVDKEASTQSQALVHGKEDNGESNITDDSRNQNNMSKEDPEIEESSSCSPSTYPGWCTDIYGERTILSDREKLLAFLTLAAPLNTKFSYESSSSEDSKYSSPKSEQDDKNDIALYYFSSSEEKGQRCSHLQQNNIDNGVPEHKTSVSPEKNPDQLAQNEGESKTILDKEDEVWRKWNSVIQKTCKNPEQAASIGIRAKSEVSTVEQLSRENSTSSSIGINPNPRSGKCAVQVKEKSGKQWNGLISSNDLSANQEKFGRQKKGPISSNDLSANQEKFGRQSNGPISSNDLSADQENFGKQWNGPTRSNDLSADQNSREEEFETIRIAQQVKHVLPRVYNSSKPGSSNPSASAREVHHGRWQTSMSSIHTFSSLEKHEVKTTDSRVSPLKQVKSLDNKPVKTGRTDVKEQYSPERTYGSIGWAASQQEQYSIRYSARRTYPRTTASIRTSSRGVSERTSCGSARPRHIMNSKGEMSPYVPLISKSSLRSSEQKRNRDRSQRGRKTILPKWDENWNLTSDGSQALKLVGNKRDMRYTKPTKPRKTRLGPGSEKHRVRATTYQEFENRGMGWLDIAISLGVVICWPVWLEFKGKKLEMERRNGVFCAAFIFSSLAVLIAVNGRCFSEISEMVILVLSSLLYLLYSVIRLYSSMFLGGSWEGLAAAAGYYLTFLLLIAKPWRALRSFRNRLKPLQYTRY